MHSVRKSLVVIVLALLATSAFAQKSGGTLRFPLRENPSSASLHEESSITAMQPFMAVFNNLVMYDQHQEMARPESIKPDLATEWSWSSDNRVLTMKLRQGAGWATPGRANAKCRSIIPTANMSSPPAAR